jgi:DNA-3-methyladenine glycosylase
MAITRDVWKAFHQPAPVVAPQLLGSLLTHKGVTVRVTEVEAYTGVHDAASHAWRGKTKRNEVMFNSGGYIYVYLIYGVHYCLNLVCGSEGEPSAVLLRAGDITWGHEAARIRRPGVADHKLASGPGNLCRALGIDLTQNGSRLGEDIELSLASGLAPQLTKAGQRIGISLARELPWRWWLQNEKSVSRLR